MHSKVAQLLEKVDHFFEELAHYYDKVAQLLEKVAQFFEELITPYFP